MRRCITFQTPETLYSRRPSPTFQSFTGTPLFSIKFRFLLGLERFSPMKNSGNGLISHHGFSPRSRRSSAMTRSTIGSDTFGDNSNEPLSVTIFTVLRVESQSTWQGRH